MSLLLKTLPLLATLAAAPALAQPADPHAGHHPQETAAAAAAKPDAKPDAKATDAQGCPMMAQMHAAQGTATSAKGADASAMMTDGHMAHCTTASDGKPAAPAAKPAAPEHDHEHK
ncbi:MAG TPA: hypothetical protein VFH92_14265 [Phenylobacterium sp.]|nr:hypothetical protein [Phenylobacterium sp.]